MKEGGCPKGGFQCGDGRCLSRSRWCDGQLDCRGGEDEKEQVCLLPQGGPIADFFNITASTVTSCQLCVCQQPDQHCEAPTQPAPHTTVLPLCPTVSLLPSHTQTLTPHTTSFTADVTLTSHLLPSPLHPLHTLQASLNSHTSLTSHTPHTIQTSRNSHPPQTSHNSHISLTQHTLQTSHNTHTSLTPHTSQHILFTSRGVERYQYETRKGEALSYRYQGVHGGGSNHEGRGASYQPYTGQGAGSHQYHTEGDTDPYQYPKGHQYQAQQHQGHQQEERQQTEHQKGHQGYQHLEGHQARHQKGHQGYQHQKHQAEHQGHQHQTGHQVHQHQIGHREEHQHERDHQGTPNQTIQEVKSHQSHAKQGAESYQHHESQQEGKSYQHQQPGGSQGQSGRGERIGGDGLSQRRQTRQEVREEEVMSGTSSSKTHHHHHDYHYQNLSSLCYCELGTQLKCPNTSFTQIPQHILGDITFLNVKSRGGLRLDSVTMARYPTLITL
ncbi:hypothetical protein Pcinc_029695 [Petrolisthes cinctipes]|uniref:Uncharacterized protein n=1 Tax=Petrolisthes cinctipes TaxID=88211 RepID=A0AAE1F0I4_PETCI|nr:hypothetical protein Pcinc_029695 [Petrolisthes cinctipes]